MSTKSLAARLLEQFDESYMASECGGAVKKTISEDLVGSLADSIEDYNPRVGSISIAELLIAAKGKKSEIKNILKTKAKMSDDQIADFLDENGHELGLGKNRYDWKTYL